MTAQAAFIALLEEYQALRFGDFVTKAGRRSPYFINLACIASGRGLMRLAELYSQAIQRHWPDLPSHVFGPAYKGIALSVLTAEHLYQRSGQDVHVVYNRKEAKDHGEGGAFIGAALDAQSRVLLVEDVLTGGTSLRETVALLRPSGAQIIGAFVGIDRLERGTGALHASAEISALYGFPVHSLVNIQDIVLPLTRGNEPLRTQIKSYWQRYCPALEGNAKKKADGGEGV